MSKAKTKTIRPSLDLGLGIKTASSGTPAKTDSIQVTEGRQVVIAPESDLSTAGPGITGAQKAPAPISEGDTAKFFNMGDATKESGNSSNTSSAQDKELEEIAEKESKRPTSLRLSKEIFIFEEKVFRESKFKSKQEMRHTLYLNSLSKLAESLGVITPKN